MSSKHVLRAFPVGDVGGCDKRRRAARPRAWISRLVVPEGIEPSRSALGGRSGKRACRDGTPFRTPLNIAVVGRQIAERRKRFRIPRRWRTPGGGRVLQPHAVFLAHVLPSRWAIHMIPRASRQLLHRDCVPGPRNAPRRAGLTAGGWQGEGFMPTRQGASGQAAPDGARITRPGRG